jgi:hypothetical protein
MCSDHAKFASSADADSPLPPVVKTEIALVGKSFIKDSKGSRESHCEIAVFYIGGISFRGGEFLQLG